MAKGDWPAACALGCRSTHFRVTEVSRKKPFHSATFVAKRNGNIIAPRPALTKGPLDPKIPTLARGARKHSPASNLVPLGTFLPENQVDLPECRAARAASPKPGPGEPAN